MKGAEVVRALERAGWSVLRQRGSHVIMGHNGLRVTVPVHAGRDIPPGTLANICRSAGLTIEQLRDLL